MCSLIGRVAYILNLAVVPWRLATCGHRGMPSFSRVRSLFFIVLPLLNILVDVRGKLWGEDIIRQHIDAPNLRYRQLDPVSPTTEPRVGHTLVPRNRSNISPTSSTNDAVWKSIRDWEELIRLVLKSHYISILIESIYLGPSRVCSVEDSMAPSHSH
jgi:hypothetical protein